LDLRATAEVEERFFDSEPANSAGSALGMTMLAWRDKERAESLSRLRRVKVRGKSEACW